MPENLKIDFESDTKHGVVDFELQEIITLILEPLQYVMLVNHRQLLWRNLSGSVQNDLIDYAENIRKTVYQNAYTDFKRVLKKEFRLSD